MAGSNATVADDPLNVDITNPQTISNLASFILGFSFCVIAFIAQIANIVLVFRQTAGKTRRIFFYLLLTSAILCAVVFISNGWQLLIIYFSGHSLAWMWKLRYIDPAVYPDLAALWNYYNSLSRAFNVAYSMFTLLYILCVQLRFQSIRAIFQYPIWVDYVLYALTIFMWVGTDLVWEVALYDAKSGLDQKLALIWTVYVLLADNVLSGVFLWRLWKALKEVRNFSQRRGKISRSIIKSMIGMCVAMWVSLIIFTANVIIFSDDENLNVYSAIFELSLAVLPLFFTFGFVWMQAVLQLYSNQPNSSRSATAPTHGAQGITLSMNANVSQTGKVGWSSDKEQGLDSYDERYIAFPPVAASREEDK